MALLNEISIAKPDAGVENWWAMMEMPQGSEIGGKNITPLFSHWHRPLLLGGGRQRSGEIQDHL